jgi:hypothetical protein
MILKFLIGLILFVDVLAVLLGIYGLGCAKGWWQDV